MKGIKFFGVLMLAVCLASSCDKNGLDDTQEVYLEVNANNISGKWELVEANGSALVEGMFVYLEIVRNDRTFTLYQNHNGFVDDARIMTGSYNLDTDPELGAIIRGVYDHDSGDWDHRYIIKDLTATKMTWIAKDDPSYIQVFSRIDSIPVASE
jgi:hypothetical protein